MLNPIGKTHHKREFCNGFTRQTLMIHKGILMETIRISVMVPIGLLFFLLAGSNVSQPCS